jgi:pSer/pThr/pTyr-binding forkhead associated (FHA) protein
LISAELSVGRTGGNDLILNHPSVSRKHARFHPDKVIIVIVGNASQIREPLGTLGMPIHELDIAGMPIA